MVLLAGACGGDGQPGPGPNRDGASSGEGVAAPDGAIIPENDASGWAERANADALGTSVENQFRESPGGVDAERGMDQQSTDRPALDGGVSALSDAGQSFDAGSSVDHLASGDAAWRADAALPPDAATLPDTTPPADRAPLSDGAPPDSVPGGCQPAGPFDVYVDAANGDDRTGTGSQGCPFKSITRALAAIGGTSGVTVHVAAGTYGPLQTNEAFPEGLSSGTTIESAGGTVSIAAPSFPAPADCNATSVKTCLFYVDGLGVTLKGLTLSNQGPAVGDNAGVVVAGGATVTLDGDTIEGCTGSGVVGEPDSTLVVDQGTLVTGNRDDGLQLLANTYSTSAYAVIQGGSGLNGNGGAGMNAQGAFVASSASFDGNAIGILLSGTSAATLDHCDVSGSARDGLMDERICPASGCVDLSVQYSTFMRNGGAGVRVYLNSSDGTHRIDFGGGSSPSAGQNQLDAPASTGDQNEQGGVCVVTAEPVGDALYLENDRWSTAACPPNVTQTGGCGPGVDVGATTSALELFFGTPALCAGAGN
jgi:hypothetical protein